MKNLTINRTSGDVITKLQGKDHYSGLAMYLPTGSAYPVGTADSFSALEPVKPVSSTNTAIGLGITPESPSWYIRALYYHISEALRFNSGIILYVGLFIEKAANFDFKELENVQYYTNGEIRQLAVYAPSRTLTDADVVLLKTIADNLSAQAMPLSILYAPTITEIDTLPNLRLQGRNRITVVISQSADDAALALFNHADNATHKALSTIGLMLGMVALAAVHESIGWVSKFPTGITKPAFSEGSLFRNTDKALIQELDDFGYLFLVTHTGISGAYANDSYSLDLETSEFRTIESNRTMDKAERGIRIYLTPYLSSPIYVNPTTGKLRSDVIAFLETLAGKQLEDMEAAGEISGYIVQIDPDQNVLTTSTVEFVIKQVAVGVMRTMNVKIGYATKI